MPDSRIDGTVDCFNILPHIWKLQLEFQLMYDFFDETQNEFCPYLRKS